MSITKANTKLKQHRNKVKVCDPQLSFYVQGFPAPDKDWKWTAEAWDAARSADGRIVQVINECIQHESMSAESHKALKTLFESKDVLQGQTMRDTLSCQISPSTKKLLQHFEVEVKDDLHIEVKPYPEPESDIEVKPYFEPDIEVEPDPNPEIGPNVGLYLKRYIIEGGKGTDSQPFELFKTFAVHFATDIEKPVNDRHHRVVIKIMFNQKDANMELHTRLIDIFDTHSDIDIPQEFNEFDSDLVAPLLRYHDDVQYRDNKNCCCLVFSNETKGMPEIIGDKVFFPNEAKGMPETTYPEQNSKSSLQVKDKPASLDDESKNECDKSQANNINDEKEELKVLREDVQTLVKESKEYERVLKDLQSKVILLEQAEQTHELEFSAKLFDFKKRTEKLFAMEQKQKLAVKTECDKHRQHLQSIERKNKKKIEELLEKKKNSDKANQDLQITNGRLEQENFTNTSKSYELALSLIETKEELQKCEARNKELEDTAEALQLK